MTKLQKATAAVTGSISPVTAVIVLACIGSMTYLADAGRINGDAIVAIFSAIIGGVLVGSGTSGGSKASTAPPPDA